MFSHAFIPFPSYLPVHLTQTFPILPSPSHYSNLSHSTFPFYLIKPSPLLITQTFPILPSPSLYSNLSHPTFPFYLIKPFPSYLPLLFTQTFPILPSPSLYSNLGRHTFPFSLLNPFSSCPPFLLKSLPFFLFFLLNFCSSPAPFNLLPLASTQLNI